MSAHAAGRTVWNTNRLLRSYSGADGIKTGYTRAAGYNLATTAQRGNKRVVVVVMGMGSPSGRNKEAARLLDLGFKRAKSRVAVVRPSFHRSGSKRPRVEVVQAPLPPRPPFEKRRKGGSLIAEALAPSAIASDGPGTPEIIGSEFAPYQLAKMPLPRPVEGSEDVVEVVTATPTTCAHRRARERRARERRDRHRCACHRRGHRGRACAGGSPHRLRWLGGPAPAAAPGRRGRSERGCGALDGADRCLHES